MCFTPQRRALFHHLNFQKWSEHGVLCTFWLGNVLPATTTCTFSSSQLLKMLRTWGVFTFFTGKCASRHNGVRFFDISTSKSGPDLVCFVHFDFEMCFAHLRATTACNCSSLIWPARSAPAALASLLFDPPEPQIIGKTCFATFLPFRAPGSSFFWDFFFFDILSSSLLFAASSHLCFSSVHIVGSLTSKLPSLIIVLAPISSDITPVTIPTSGTAHPSVPVTASVMSSMDLVSVFFGTFGTSETWRMWTKHGQKLTKCVEPISQLFRQAVFKYHNKIIYIYMYIYTSSTAQGGGGRFKNRKPIGEVGCCESRMAERIHWWTDRWLELCFWNGCNGCSGHLTTTAGCSVV